VIVAPAQQQSGKGGTVIWSETANLTIPSQYNIIPAGAPSVGRDPSDANIWYYDGTPAACTFVALDWVLPRYYPDWHQTADLFLAGPNYGTNLGAFVMGLSGTIGATFAAISRSIPGIALSASNKAVPYFYVTGASHPAVVAAKVSYEVVNGFIENTMDGQAILPLGYGVNVNIPTLVNGTTPPIIKTRLTGNANTDVAVYNETTGLFDWDNIDPVAAGINAAYNGDTSLPGETFVVAGGGVSVSVFTMDFTAPSIKYTDLVFNKIEGLVAGYGMNATSGYSKQMVQKRMHKRGVMLTGRDGGA
jgi:5'-nucleotidase